MEWSLLSFNHSLPYFAFSVSCLYVFFDLFLTISPGFLLFLQVLLDRVDETGHIDRLNQVAVGFFVDCLNSVLQQGISRDHYLDHLRSYVPHLD